MPMTHNDFVCADAAPFIHNVLSFSACANRRMCVMRTTPKSISKKNEILTCRPRLLLVYGVRVCEIGIGNARKYTFQYNCVIWWGHCESASTVGRPSAGTYLLMFFFVPLHRIYFSEILRPALNVHSLRCCR